MATSGVGEDKYRKFLYGEGERDTKWRFGSPPNYDAVNKLFEEGRTKVWPPGSLEEKVQNLVKTWEMEMFNKTCFDDYKSVDLKNYTFSLNGMKPSNFGRKAQTWRRLQHLSADHLTGEVPGTGVIWKVRSRAMLQLGKVVELHGMSIFQVDEHMKVVKVEFFMDRGELLGGLMKGASLDGSAAEAASACPFLSGTG
ncbi:PATHOGEN-RELATED PROTEIN-LIKE [Salix viminalis]|uniref:PATHOGEN-RELATED PROTEIN-LIKE n=1 Tax=Salix viminalis TaxID=40686 RepID=A0A9Q0ZIP2_SALVM|nr:PATHOGEN-RELATED PROTEIN-LIKE [Salix viminalis]